MRVLKNQKGGNKMDKKITIRINRFNDKIIEVLYFIIDKRLNRVSAVVKELEDIIEYYPVAMCGFWNVLANDNIYEIAGNPIGENYESGNPSTLKKEYLLGDDVDFTKSKDEVYFILTGKKKKAFNNNVI